MNADILVYQAKSFYNAFIALEQLRDQQDQQLFYVPTIVNGAFSIELTLKAILSKLGILYNKEHNLLSLYNLLPDKIQELLWQYLVIKAPEYDNRQCQIEELTMISNAFVDMRYLYEVPIVPALNTRFLSAFANASIYMMFALGFNVDLVQTDNDKTDSEIEKLFEENRTQYIKKINETLQKKK